VILPSKNIVYQLHENGAVFLVEEMKDNLPYRPRQSLMKSIRLTKLSLASRFRE
jgi:hypothetical protein